MMTTYNAHSGQLGYVLYLPPRINHRHLLVAVHGVRSRASTIIEHFAGVAESSGFVVMAPDFSAKRFVGYQRLEGADGVDQAASALDLGARDLAERIGLEPHSFNLFGFSAGAQFAHRYAMTRPRRINQLIIAAAGWYTECDLDSPFPDGLQGVADDASLRDFLSLPITVAVGERDTRRDSQLRRTDALDERQGRNRLERARFWVNQLRRTAAALELEHKVSFKRLPRTAHHFSEAIERGGLAKLVAEKITASDPVALGEYPGRRVPQSIS